MPPATLRTFHPLRRALLASLAITASLAQADTLSTPGGGGMTLTHCINNNTGNPCGTESGPASLFSTTGLNVGAGNPLSLLSGNKYQQEVDMPALPGVLGLEIVRHYNSLRSGGKAVNGILGRGWRLSYETELYVVNDTVQIVQADGARIIFARDAKHPNLCTSQDPARGKLLISKKARGEEYVWVWPTGRKLSFNTQGKLIQIAAPTGEFVALTHDPDGNLLKVTDPQGRSLNLSYYDRRLPNQFHGVQHIDGPLGRVTYSYGSKVVDPAARGAHLAIANLVSAAVAAPNSTPNRANNAAASTIIRHYHYEDARYPTFLTGISIAGTGSDGKTVNERLGTYGYDSEGRAVLSLRGPKPTDGKPGPEQVTLDFSQPGKTLLTNSLGQKTTYLTTKIGSERRLLEVRGPGCASCGETNVRYGYDTLGRLTVTTTLDAQGQPLGSTQRDLDAASRPLRVTRTRYVNGKPQPIDWVRYEYAVAASNVQVEATSESFLLPDPRPILLARPSVVPGQEHQTRVTYNALGQPLTITESGYAPVIDGDAKLSSGGSDPQPKAQPSAITRSQTYRYQLINGRSVLVEIDGPLANGSKNDPSDSDITRYVWDGRGNHLIGIERPGGFQDSLRYDSAGRVAELARNDGVRQIVTTTTYSPVGPAVLQPERIERQAGGLKLVTLQARHDALGRRTTSLDATGREMRFTYDSAGHLTTLGDASGHQARRDLDREGHLQRAGLYRPGQENEPYRATYYWRDDLGRQTARLLPDGRLDTWTYDDAGQIAEHTDGDEVITRYLESADKQLKVRVDQSPDGGLRLNLGRNQGGAFVDDFGHLLRQRLPDHGTKTARYDVANRIVRIVNADGSRIDYTYDTAGRLVKKATTDVQGKTETVELTYDGRVLSERRDAAQTSRYAYDALGRKIGETVQLAGLQKPIETGTRFDPATGLIEARMLADGRVMRIERTDAPHGATPHTLRLQPAWAAAIEDWLTAHVSVSIGETVGSWLPHDPIAQNITIDPFDGLTGVTAGNGLATKRSYDIAGRLTKLNIQKVGELTYRYRNGPRIQAIDSPLMKADYRYSGFGRLQPAIGTDVDLALPVTKSDSPVAAPKYDQLGRTVEDAHYRYTYTAAGAVETVSDKTGKPIATYRYNSLGQRVAKTVNGLTTHTLWQAGNRVAEIDGNGNIEAQYLYLAEGRRSTPIAKLEAGHIHYIHTDHRGAPLAMTDERQAIVWRANLTPWGRADPVGAHPEAGGGASGPVPRRLSFEPSAFGPASLNLRLPGQYYDEETGLHDNWHRTYDPSTGRYLQPDPLGYPDGPDAYLYVSGDPINKIDPLGLYDADVHYYMTYFLALLAGLSETDAWIVATANQTMDNVNPYTDAMPFEGDGLAVDQRTKYHFTQDGYDPKATPDDYIYENVFHPETGMESLEIVGYTSEYQLRRLGAWNNPQIQLLHGYAVKAGSGYGPCVKLQFYGEYLHALQDTFGHRKANNDPFGDFWGHAFDDHDPDKTYNDDEWQNNEDRTLAMEEVVFNQLQADMGKQINDKNGNPITWDSIKGLMEEWNKVREIGDLKSGMEKFDKLDAALGEFGLPKIKRLQKYVGLGCRLKYLRDALLINADGKATSDGLKDYPGAILDTKTDGASECKPLSE